MIQTRAVLAAKETRLLLDQVSPIVPPFSLISQVLSLRVIVVV